MFENKKSLVITGLNQKLQPLFPIITNKREEDLIIINSVGPFISQPYGCLVRNVILAVYNENIEDVFIIGEVETGSHESKKKELYSKLQDSGITVKTIHTINYIEAVKPDFLAWLAGPADAKEAVQSSIKLLKSNPILPDSLPVYGYIVDVDSGEFKTV
ncbi:carbonic anhydrase [Sutcliffiella deserti]|uniref:hypothetical protein n=1 Tax=Sutcliffiella deserti TaxID=2875501 RepID=UPI001CBC7DE2|nr:hypothetical protein [Sutcliffiella deserti]